MATSQNTVVPPLPSTISQPSGSPNSSASPARTAPTRCFTGGWRCDVPITDVAAGDDGVELLGADLGRPAAEAPVGREQVLGDAQRGGGGGGHCDSMSPDLRRSERVVPVSRGSERRVSARLAGDRRVGHARRRRQGQGAAGRRARTSSASAPASPTSRRPTHIVEAAVAACRDPKNHRYTPAGGLPELKEAIAAKTKRDSGFDCAAAQVLVTNGGKHAVFTAFAALCDPGDEVICPAPYWTTYPEAITLAGGVPVVIDTTEETGFQVTVDQLEAAVHRAHQGAAVRQPGQPVGRGVPARGRSRRSGSGRSSAACG